MSLERERDPQMSDLRVQCYGQVVQINEEFCFIFQVQIKIEKENDDGVEIPVRLVFTSTRLNVVCLKSLQMNVKVMCLFQIALIHFDSEKFYDLKCVS